MNQEFTTQDPKANFFLKDEEVEMPDWTRVWAEDGILVESDETPGDQEVLIPVVEEEGSDGVDPQGNSWFDRFGNKWKWKETEKETGMLVLKSPDHRGKFTEVLGGSQQTTRRLACYVGDDGGVQLVENSADPTNENFCPDGAHPVHVSCWTSFV
jgi:hypothetical protein